MNNMKRRLTLVIALVMMLSCFGCFCFSANAAEKQDIVRDGLVAWYDGSNNGNGVQDLEATVWKDLSGNGNHMNVKNDEKNHWQQDAYYTDTTSHYFPENVFKAVCGEAYTLEMAFGDLTYTGTNYPSFARSDNDMFSLFVRQSDDYLEFKFVNYAETRPIAPGGGALSKDATLTVVFEEAGEDGRHAIHLYVNGVLQASGSGSRTGAGVLDSLYFCDGNEERAWSGEVHAIRVYDRALDADEITDNAAADEHNYRKGNKFEPTKEYLEDGEEWETDEPAEVITYTNDLIPFTKAAGVLSWHSVFGEVIYPYGDEWEGARFQIVDPDADDVVDTRHPGDTGFPNIDINYEKFTRMNSLEVLTGEDVGWVVLRLKVKGNLTDLHMWEFSGDNHSLNDTTYNTGSWFEEVKKTEDEQFLIYDLDGAWTGAINGFLLSPEGYDDTTEIYMYDMAFFKTAEEAFAYAGEEYVVETEPEETEPEVVETEAQDTEAQGGEAQDTEAQGTEAQGTDAATDEGCASVVGFGAAAVLAAVAAAVVLKKRD